MKKYNRELKQALRKMGFSARITQGTLRMRTPLIGYKIAGAAALGGWIALLVLLINEWRAAHTFNPFYTGLIFILLISSVVLLFGVKGEYYIVNRQLKTIRDVRSKNQVPDKYDYPPVITIEDIDKRGKYHRSYLCFKKGDTVIDTISFNRGKFKPGRPEELAGIFTLWLTQGKVSLPELSPDSSLNMLPSPDNQDKSI